MSIRLREAETQAEIREMKQRMMEMETQVWRAGPGEERSIRVWQLFVRNFYVTKNNIKEIL